MGTSSGWDHRQPPAPGHTRPPVDQSGEPVGYNLSDLPMYEQPPPQQLQPYRAAPRSQADQGFRISLVGLLTSVFLLTAPIAVVGVVISAIALRRSQPGDRDQSTAVAGIILGILGLLVMLLELLNGPVPFGSLRP